MADGVLPVADVGGRGDVGARLAEAHALVAAGDVSALSLDVFDTLLWRSVPRPTDVFLLLGVELRDRGELRPWIEPATFRRLRIAAEARARRDRERARGSTEVTLEGIWGQFPQEVLVDPDPQRLAEAEVDCERRVTFPDLDVVALAQAAQKASAEILLVSNTYLSRRSLERLLDRPELSAVRSARLFPSCAFGVHKKSGLWDAVLDEVGVPARRLLHVGDDEECDVEAPGKLGIRTVHYPRLDPALEEILLREKALPPDPFGPSPIFVHERSGDYGTTGLRARTMARVETDSLPLEVAQGRQLGATVLGPALAGYADWVHRRALARGVETVWCMMREGEFLAELVNRVASSRQSGLVAREIWMSRHLTARASLQSADEDELLDMLKRRTPPTLAQFLEYLGLGLGDLPDLRNESDTRLVDRTLVETLVDRLASSDYLRARILDEARGARSRLVAYLERTVDLSAETLVMVDLGWGGTIQHQLQMALRSAGVSTKVVVLYLMTNDLSCDRVLGGLEMEAYLGACGEPANAVRQVGRTPELLEQACLATTGSILDFTEDGTPVLDGSVPSPPQVRSKLAVQEGIRAYQRELLRYERTVAPWIEYDGGERSVLLEILRRLVVNPTASEAQTLGAWSHEDNMGSHTRELIVPRHLQKCVPYLSPLDLLELTMAEAFWPMGLAAEYDPPLAEATAALVDGSVTYDAFRPSTPVSTMELWVDKGEGFVEPVPCERRVNRNGLTYAHFRAEHPEIVGIRFDPCDHAAVVRLDWIELRCTVRGQSTPVIVRFEKPQDLAGLTYSGCQWLYDGVLFAPDDDPQVHVNLRPFGRPGVCGVDVQVSMAVLPLPPRASMPRFDGVGYGVQARRFASKLRAELAAGGLMAAGKGAARVATRGIRRVTGS